MNHSQTADTTGRRLVFTESTSRLPAEAAGGFWAATGLPVADYFFVFPVVLRRAAPLRM